MGEKYNEKIDSGLQMLGAAYLVCIVIVLGIYIGTKLFGG